MKQRAFVRYTKSGKIVPGSMIVTAGSYPTGPALWAELSFDLCCDDPEFTTTSRVKGFVRYTKKGKIIPGTLILDGKYPQDGGLWRDVTINLCCNPQPALRDFILLENSVPGNPEYLLQEDGGRILL